MSNLSTFFHTKKTKTTSEKLEYFIPVQAKKDFENKVYTN